MFNIGDKVMFVTKDKQAVTGLICQKRQGWLYMRYRVEYTEEVWEDGKVKYDKQMACWVKELDIIKQYTKK